MIKKLFFYGILIIGGFFCIRVNAIPINPDKTAMPVVITDADTPSTYTGTLRNPLNVRIREGTVTSVTTLNQGTVTIIEKPVWESQPIDINNVTFIASVSPYATYTYAQTWTFSVSDYGDYLEYIVIVRNESYAPDNYSFEFHTGQTGNQLFLGADVAPASGQSIFKPPIPIKVSAGANNGYRITLWNKSPHSQTFKVGMVFSRRKL